MDAKNHNYNSLKFSLIAILLLSSTACGVEVQTSGDTNGQLNNGEEEWLIPESEIISAQGKDGIPSIDNPNFSLVSEIDFIPDDRFILGVKVGDEIRAYPKQIMDYHEVVNDVFDERNVAITYCPLTGTGISIDRGRSEFGVSGLLFRNNLIMYDRSTESRWSQMQMRSVYGRRKGNNVSELKIIETTWGTWKRIFPKSKVLNKETGYDRDYSNYAYGNSVADGGSASLFPIKNPDDRLDKFEIVHGVIASPTADEDAVVKAYAIKDFGDSILVINDILNEDEVVVVGSTAHHFAVSYYGELDGKSLVFEAVQDSLPIILKDQEGNRWDLFGQAVSGPRMGQKLTPIRSYSGYWFAWADFFPNIQLHNY